MADLSRVVFGTMRMTSWGANLDADGATALLAAARDHGLTSIDCADIYGHYTVEALLGEAFKKDASLKETLRVVTKTSIKLPCDLRPEFPVKAYDTSRSHVEASVAASKAALGLDQLPLLLLHRPDHLTSSREAAASLRRLVEKGDVARVGVSNYNLAQLAALRTALEDEGGDVRLCVNQIEASIVKPLPLLDGTADAMVTEHKGLTVQAWSPLAGGALFDPAHADGARIVAAIEKMQKVSVDFSGLDVSTVALAWLMRHSANIAPVVGTTKVERIAEAARARDIADKMSGDQWYKLMEAAIGREID